MRQQRRCHTLVSHLRGPETPLSFGGWRILSAAPIGVGESGNCTVSFEVLSYNGTLTITAIIDPDHFPDGDVLTVALENELGAMSSRSDPAVNGVDQSADDAPGGDEPVGT
jgi:hypothetical protein